MRRPQLQLKSAEVVEITVLRHGNVNDVTFVGWESADGTAVEGVNYLGESGKLYYFTTN